MRLFAYLFIYFIPAVAFGVCDLKPEAVGANYLDSRGPVTKDYEVFLVATTLGGGNDRRFYEKPAYIFLSRNDCKILKEIRLPKKSAAQKMLISEKANKILIMTAWYTESGEIKQSLAAHEYANFQPLYHKEINNTKISPSSSMMINADASNLYILSGNEIFLISISDSSELGRYVADDDYMESMKLGDYKYLLLTDTDLSKKKHWSELAETKLIDLWGVNEKGDYRGFTFNTSGEVLKTAWTSGKESFSDTPENYEQKYSIKIKPLNFIPSKLVDNEKALAPLIVKQPKNMEKSQSEPQDNTSVTSGEEKQTTITSQDSGDIKKAKQNEVSHTNIVFFIVFVLILILPVALFWARNKKH